MIGADPGTTWLHEAGVELDAKGFVVISAVHSYLAGTETT
jgi:hypothetical protein